MTDNEKKELIIGYVNLREHLEVLWIEREKRFDDRFTANTKTLEATASVLEHRLEVLNHAHKQSLEDRADFVKSPEYKSFKRDLEIWQGVVNAAITTFNTRYEFRINAATWISVVSLLVGVGSLIMVSLKL